MGELEPKIDIPTLVGKFIAPVAAASIFAANPVVGAMMASAVACLIPERRLSRLEAFVARLDEKVGRIQPNLPATTLDDESKLCLLWTHPMGWELKMAGRDLIRSQVCRTEDSVFDVSERWSSESEARGWRRK